MKLILAVAGMLIFAAPLMAETYSWEDETGTVNFTENYTSVPAKYRKNARKLGDIGSDTPSAQPAAASGTKAAPAARESAESQTSPSGETGGTFGGKKYDQWKQEFSEREAAMRGIINRIGEIDALLNKNPSSTEQTQNLIAERNRSVEQVSEMRRQYDQQVELARKAGIEVNIRQ